MTTPSFTCTLCWKTSYHPKDVENGFCGRCHQYVPGVVITDKPGWPGWRHAELLGSPDWRPGGRVNNLTVDIEPGGGVSTARFPDTIAASELAYYVNLLRVADLRVRG